MSKIKQYADSVARVNLMFWVVCAILIKVKLKGEVFDEKYRNDR